MPENPNADPDTGLEYTYGDVRTMAANNSSSSINTANNNNSNNSNNKQQIPRVSSAGLKYYDIATQLLGKAGSDIEELFIAAARDGVYERIENFLLRNRNEHLVSIDVKDKKTGNTPLIWAAKRGHAKIVQLLLRHGADITLRNYEGQSAVEVASPSIRAILLESVERGTEASHLLLLQAAWQGDIKVVSRLLAQKKVLDINCQNADGFTPIMLATRDLALFEKLATQMSRSYNPVEVVSELMSARADLHATDGDGKTCLHHAAQSKAVIASSVVSTIITGGPNLECKDKRCFAPIHCASLTGNAECISTLLDGGSEVNSRGFAGATPLHITSYNNHEKATSVLLEHGANVTLTDDRGLTALDFTKTRKMRKKLQEAWADVTSSKSTTNLGPVRAPSREDLRASLEDLSKRRKGEVIFDGIPSNPFGDGNKKDSIARESGLRRTQSLRDMGSGHIDTLPSTWHFPNSLVPLANNQGTMARQGSKGVTRHLSLKENSKRAEELKNVEGGPLAGSTSMRDGVRRLGQVRNQKPNPLPRTKSRSTERLPVLSPDRTGSDRNRESPVHFSRNARERRSFEDRKQGLNNRGRSRAPLSSREPSVAGDDVFDRLTPAPPSPTPSVRHKRSESDPNRLTPNLLELAAVCEPYLQHGNKRGRSCSESSNHATDFEMNRHTPIQRENAVTGVQRETTLMSVCSYRTDSRMSTNSNSPRLLNLGQMLPKSKTPVQNVPLYGPGSSKVLPPTPTFITQRGLSDMGPKSESDHSPRSDDGIDKSPLENPVELLRSRTKFKDEFILEETRPKDPFMQSSSGTDTYSSSGSGSSQFSTPREQQSAAKTTSVYSKVGNSVNTQARNGGNNVDISVGVSKPKLNEKPMATQKSNTSGMKIKANDRSADRSVKGGKLILNTNKKSKEILNDAVSVKKVMPNSANKTVNESVSEGRGAKSGGVIVMHGDSKVQRENESEISENGADNNLSSTDDVRSSVTETNKDVAKFNANARDRRTAKNNAQVAKDECKANEKKDSNSNSNAKISNSTKSDLSSMKENKFSKTVPLMNQKQDELQVVPTKLSENIINSNKDNNPQTVKVVSSSHAGTKPETNNKSKSGDNVQVNNVNMKLSSAAGVRSRVENRAVSVQKNDSEKNAEVVSNNAKDKSANTNGMKDQSETSQDGKVNVSKTPASAIGTSMSNNQSTNSSQKQSNTNQTVKQSTSAQPNNRQGAQSRNLSTPISRSAGAMQRQTGNVRKTPTFTPRFSSSQRTNSSQGDKSNSKKSNSTLGKVESASTEDKSVAKSNPSQNLNLLTNTKSTDGQQDDSVKNTSPTDLVPPAVSKSASMSKSYNMASSQKSARSQSINSATTANDSSKATIANISSSVSKEDSSKTSSVKGDTVNSTVNKIQSSNSKSGTVLDSNKKFLSKSTSERLSGSAKVSSASIVSKSISQMPGVGTVTDSKAVPKGLLRSSSMSTIEEANEKKLMSLSDTKIECKTTQKKRPASDGPAGATSSAEKSNTIVPSATTPLVQIIPDCAPRLSKTPYIDANSQLSTPVIVNPFEELEQKREKENFEKLGVGARAFTATDFGFVVEKPSNERSKTQTSLKSKSTKNTRKTKEGAPTSANARGASGKRKKSRTKESNKSDGESSRPKSGKSGRRVRSGKRKRKIPESNLSKENEKPDVALIGGIGWHVATSCLDKTDVDAVVVSQISDSSESESEDISEYRPASPLNVQIPPPLPLLAPTALDPSSNVSSPRFKEVRPSFDTREILPRMANDGYPPMNLDMTQSSSHQEQQNRSGVYISQNIPDDISGFLARLKQEENEDFDNIEDDDEDDPEYDLENSEELNAIRHDILVGKLTPIPESPSITHTPSALKSVARTVEAINKFDEKVKDEDLNKLLGVSPRGSHSASFSDGSVRESAGSLRSSFQRDAKPVHTSVHSANSKGQTSRSTSSKTNVTGKSLNTLTGERMGSSQRQQSDEAKLSDLSTVNKVGQSSRSAGRSNSKIDKIKEKYEISSKSAGANGGSKNVKHGHSDSSDSGIESKGDGPKRATVDLKKLLTEKMESTKKLLEESTRTRSGHQKKQNTMGNDKQISDKMEPAKNEMEIDVKELENDIVVNLVSQRTDDDMKSSRSSQKGRKFSETKPIPDQEDDIDDAIDEIMSNTFPSMRSTLKSNTSRSKSSTLTEKDRAVLEKLAKENDESPFHAKPPSTKVKKSIRESSSYDDSLTLNRDNPDLMHRFQADELSIAKKVNIMMAAGADPAKIKAMIKADREAKQIAGTDPIRSKAQSKPDNEAVQLARIMASFSQMELYAGPSSTNNRSGKRETPRREPEYKSLSKFEHHVSASHKQQLPRPGSAGGGRFKAGKFTEVKEMAQKLRSHSPTTVPKDLAEEIKRSPYVQVGINQEELPLVMRPNTPDSESDDRLSLDDTMERPDTSSSRNSMNSPSLLEETIQWKKGNVLGKGAFGTVWCGLTSEGHLIAVKQIELNTNNQNKAKREYDKVQEEVELLKTLEHKNIVGYLGTSLEESIVSIFMQFVPGGSIASILARFGALDEAVFRKYTRQILEGVQYLHQNDVIHRDIKGGNVMLMPNGVIKLIDFGCAKRLCINLSMGQSEILKSMKGTPYWMAPEVVNETGHGKKSDIWSIGCTVFEMATRKPPWADMNPMAAIFAIGSDKPIPQLPERFSQDTRDFVNLCLTRNQQKRLSASELLMTPFLMKRRGKKKENVSNC